MPILNTANAAQSGARGDRETTRGAGVHRAIFCLSRTAVMSSLLLAISLPVGANHQEHTHDHGAQDDAAVVADEFVNAEIKAIDHESGKVMLKHEAIRKFNMNGMTMGFRVADRKKLESLAVGDKVRFIVDRVNGQLVIREIEKLQ
ncbi:MAG: hypothetical protein RL404_994 [Pseudomonadota bacterium]